jgi:hypothetical protein
MRVLADFQKANDVLYRKPFPLPRIANLLQKLESFKYAMALDLSMAYYNVPLDQHSQMLHRMILPWGIYRYLHYLWVLKISQIYSKILSKKYLATANSLEYT